MSAGSRDLFLDLTPERVLDAVEAGGLDPTGLCYPLNSFENRVYEVELADGDRVVAKFYRPGRWSREQILEEHRLLRALDEAEIAVCTVQPFADGETLKTINGVHYALSPRRGGRAPDELTPELARRLGRWLGRMHNVAATLESAQRPRLDADRYVRQALEWIDAWVEAGGTFSDRLRSRYRAAADSLAGSADTALADVDTHLVHADLHFGNVLLRDGPLHDDQLRVLDFDDMAVGSAVQDIWLVLPGRDDDETLALRETLLTGYEEFRAFDRSTLDLIETLRGLRLVRYAGWLARRWHDPAFQSGWPHFGTDDYWRRETEDLEEQAALVEKAGRGGRVERGADTAVEVETEETLSNKDYFWDWEEE